MYKYYYLYQITNLINGKIYVGIHRTNDLEDGYMGSGFLLKKAKEKYGIDNFNKEILEFFDSEDDMFAKEIELVDVDFVLRDDTYNLTEGGNGGSFTASSKGGKIGGKKTGYKNGKLNGKYIYDNKLGIFSDEVKEKTPKYLLSEENLIHLCKIRDKALSKKAQTKRKETMRLNKHQQGKKNSQYGKMWITNGIDSKKIDKEGIIPLGWKRGRVQKKK